MADSAEESSIALLDRSSRATRGKRMTKLLDEEIEEDELFWNQDALKEVEDDANYDQEDEVADEFDSDFDEDEPEQDEDIEQEGKMIHEKKRLIFPGKQVKKKKKRARTAKAVAHCNDEKALEEPSLHEHLDTPNSAEGEKTVRKSTRTSVIVRQAERDAIRAALQATAKPTKRKKEGEEKRMTQEEMLLEAAQTEVMNLKTLERALARDEEVKKRAVVQKHVYDGPRVRYFSKNGCSFLEFIGLPFDAELPKAESSYPQKPTCPITGLPARYCDPKTGTPYATREAFKIIRERWINEQRTRREMDMGLLFSSLNGYGFRQTKARTPTETPCAKRSKLARVIHSSCFPRLSLLETQLSD